MSRMTDTIRNAKLLATAVGISSIESKHQHPTDILVREPGDTSSKPPSLGNPLSGPCSPWGGSKEHNPYSALTHNHKIFNLTSSSDNKTNQDPCSIDGKTFTITSKEGEGGYTSKEDYTHSHSKTYNTSKDDDSKEYILTSSKDDSRNVTNSNTDSRNVTHSNTNYNTNSSSKVVNPLSKREEEDIYNIKFCKDASKEEVFFRDGSKEESNVGTQGSHTNIDEGDQTDRNPETREVSKESGHSGTSASIESIRSVATIMSNSITSSATGKSVTFQKENNTKLVSDILGFRDPPFRELQIIVF